MKEMGDTDFIKDFLRGQQDCSKGIPHTDQGAAYNKGYQSEYESEQVSEWRAENEHGRNTTKA